MAARTKSSTAEATGTAGNSALTVGLVYTGVVQGSFPGGQCIEVLEEKTETMVTNCVFAAGGLFSSLLGFKTAYTPTLGTRVLFTYGTSASFIISAFPSDLPDSQSNRIAVSAEMLPQDFPHVHPISKTAMRFAGHTPAADMLEGEFEIGNGLGVAMQFLTLLLKMSASDRAKVECHVLNDMVRIVSEVFRHHSAFGDFQIYNDGRLNARWDGTSYEHESFGRLADRDPKLKAKNNAVDFSDVDHVRDTGRWRFSQYVGFLGDFIHTFIADPEDALGQIGSAAFRSGKARFHVGNDGTLLAQSVAEIALERVSRIVVPVELKRPEDPEGDKAAGFETLDQSFLKVWDYGPDMKDAYKTCYQLREYARWLSGFQAYARFHQLDKDWKVPSESEIPDPEWTNKELDREAASGMSTTFKQVYSCIRIMRDGSIVVMDGSGAAVVMSGGNLQLCAPRNLTLEAAGDIRMVAGQNIYMTARRSIEIAAVVGGLILKSRTWLRVLCEWGSIWMKSDAVDIKKPDTEAPTPVDPLEDPEPVILEEAIRIEATQGKTAILSSRQLLLRTSSNPDDASLENDEEGDILIEALSAKVRLRGLRGIYLLSVAGKLLIRSAGSCLIYASTFYAELRSREFLIKDALRIAGPVMNARFLISDIISSVRSIQGPKRNEKRGGNHVDIISDTAESVTNTTNVSLLDDIAKAVTVFSAASPHTAPDPWNFSPEAEFTGPKEEDDFFETLAQQHIQNDTEAAALYASWSLGSNALKAGPNTGSTGAFPGKEADQWQHSGGESLSTPSATEYKDTTAQTPLSKDTYRFKFLKRNS